MRVVRLFKTYLCKQTVKDPTNVFEFILRVTVTAMVTLSPKNVRASLYKILRKDRK